MRFLVYAFFLCLAFSFGSFPAAAARGDAEFEFEGREFSTKIPFLYVWAKYNPGVIRPGVDMNEQILNFAGPKPPAAPKIEFYEFDKPDHVEGRVESLVHGLTITLPHEYDHYGYEVRRYMNNVGRLEIFRNRYAMEQEIVNIEKAWVVFSYWREALLSELDAIDQAIKADPDMSSKIKTRFKVNQAIVKAFIIEMQSWLDANDNLLKFLADNRKQYTFEEGRFIFRRNDYVRRFLALFAAKEKAKQEMKKYDPFGLIVY